MKVTAVWIYPIKSCRGISLPAAAVTAKGFAWDREFMWVDENGKFITQRQYPDLARVRVQLEGDEIALSLESGSVEPLRFEPTLTGTEIAVQVWRSRTTAIDQGDAAAAWLQAKLGLTADFRLVRQSPQYRRTVNPEYAVEGDDLVSFADGYPFLLANTASLDDLNRRMADESQRVPMNRFRPNIVIESDQPFAEDRWRSLQIGEVIFALVKPCDRCIVTTTDQHTGARNLQREPLKTLSTFRQFGRQGILFGENMIPRNTGAVRVGDEVRVLSLAE